MLPGTKRIRNLCDGRAAAVCPGRVVAGLVVAAVLGACTTMQSSQLPPDALHAGIRSGALVEPGDTVRAITVDGEEHALTVSAVDSETIRGESSDGSQVAVAIDDVIALRRREIEPVRTTFAASYAALAVALVAFVIEVLDTW